MVAQSCKRIRREKSNQAGMFTDSFINEKFFPGLGIIIREKKSFNKSAEKGVQVPLVCIYADYWKQRWLIQTYV